MAYPPAPAAESRLERCAANVLYLEGPKGRYVVVWHIRAWQYHSMVHAGEYHSLVWYNIVWSIIVWYSRVWYIRVWHTVLQRTGDSVSARFQSYVWVLSWRDPMILRPSSVRLVLSQFGRPRIGPNRPRTGPRSCLRSHRSSE